MYETFANLVESVRNLQAETDSQQYRDEWSLGSESWAFECSIEERLESLIAEYARMNGLSWDEVNEQLCNTL